MVLCRKTEQEGIPTVWGWNNYKIKLGSTFVEVQITVFQIILVSSFIKKVALNFVKCAQHESQNDSSA